MKKFESDLAELSEINGLRFTNDTLIKFALYYDLLSRWSKKINITANVEERKFVIENILDPALAYRAVIDAERNSRMTQTPLLLVTHRLTDCGCALADVGCGGGFVGLVWQILRCDSIEGATAPALYLIDSDRKKINFCRDVIRSLGLTNAQTICARAEFLTEPLANVITTRATWNDSGLIRDVAQNHCRGIAKEKAVFVHLIGKAGSENHNSQGVFCNYSILPDNITRQILIQKF